MYCTVLYWSLCNAGTYCTGLTDPYVMLGCNVCWWLPIFFRTHRCNVLACLPTAPCVMLGCTVLDCLLKALYDFQDTQIYCTVLFAEGSLCFPGHTDVLYWAVCSMIHLFSRTCTHRCTVLYWAVRWWLPMISRTQMYRTGLFADCSLCFPDHTRVYCTGLFTDCSLCFPEHTQVYCTGLFTDCSLCFPEHTQVYCTGLFTDCSLCFPEHTQVYGTGLFTDCSLCFPERTQVYCTGLFTDCSLCFPEHTQVYCTGLFTDCSLCFPEHTQVYCTGLFTDCSLCFPGPVFYLLSWSPSHLEFFLQVTWSFSIFTPSDLEAKSLGEIPSDFGCWLGDILDHSNIVICILYLSKLI